ASIRWNVRCLKNTYPKHTARRGELLPAFYFPTFLHHTLWRFLQSSQKLLAHLGEILADAAQLVNHVSQFVFLPGGFGCDARQSRFERNEALFEGHEAILDALPVLFRAE